VFLSRWRHGQLKLHGSPAEQRLVARYLDAMWHLARPDPSAPSPLWAAAQRTGEQFVTSPRHRRFLPAVASIVLSLGPRQPLLESLQEANLEMLRVIRSRPEPQDWNYFYRQVYGAVVRRLERLGQRVRREGRDVSLTDWADKNLDALLQQHGRPEPPDPETEIAANRDTAHALELFHLLLPYLPPREATVLLQCHPVGRPAGPGQPGPLPRLLTDLAIEMGMTRSRVGQIQALGHLRGPLASLVTLLSPKALRAESQRTDLPYGGLLRSPSFRHLLLAYCESRLKETDMDHKTCKRMLTMVEQLIKVTDNDNLQSACDARTWLQRAFALGDRDAFDAGVRLGLKHGRGPHKDSPIVLGRMPPHLETRRERKLREREEKERRHKERMEQLHRSRQRAAERERDRQARRLIEQMEAQRLAQKGREEAARCLREQIEEARKREREELERLEVSRERLRIEREELEMAERRQVLARRARQPLSLSLERQRHRQEVLEAAQKEAVEREVHRLRSLATRIARERFQSDEQTIEEIRAIADIGALCRLIVRLSTHKSAEAALPDR
jgi:hypothetical protein